MFLSGLPPFSVAPLVIESSRNELLKIGFLLERYGTPIGSRSCPHLIKEIPYKMGCDCTTFTQDILNHTDERVLTDAVLLTFFFLL